MQRFSGGMRDYEYETNGYHRELEDEYEDEYYDQDEYEEEGAGEEYVDEDPPEGQKEILELRERLKEQIRRKAQAAGASTAGRLSSSHRAPPTRDKFGSFFGPSKPVISQRVIEERKSLKELHSTIARDPRPSGRDVPSSSKVQSKGNGLQHKQKIVNEAKKKAEALKDNRDYSFLLSDDADLPPSPKEKPAARPSLNQKSDREVMHSAVKSKASTSQPARLSNGHGSKNTLSTQRHADARTDSMRKDALSDRERVASRDKERIRSIIRNGPNLASASKTTSQKLPTKASIATRHPSKDVKDSSLWKSGVISRHHLSEVGRPQSSQSQRMPSSGHRPQHPSHDQRSHQSVQQRREQSLQSRRPQQMSQGQRPQHSLQSQRVQPSMQSQRQHQSSLTQKSQSSQNHRQQSQSYRPQMQGQRPISSQGQYSEQRRVQSNDRVKAVDRQIRPPSKPMPSRSISSNGIRDDHAKKKPVMKRRFDDDEDEEDPLAMIRSMFRYDPSKYAGRDEDDSDMEADFATIEMEEKRSARIARQEDEEQLRLIEEEDRREQERKRRKMARGR